MSYTGPGVIPADHEAAMRAARRRIGGTLAIRATSDTGGPLGERLAAVVDHFFEGPPMVGVAAVCGFVATESHLAAVPSAGRCPACDRIVAERGLTEGED